MAQNVDFGQHAPPPFFPDPQGKPEMIRTIYYEFTGRNIAQFCAECTGLRHAYLSLSLLCSLICFFFTISVCMLVHHHGFYGRFFLDRLCNWSKAITITSNFPIRFDPSFDPFWGLAFKMFVTYCASRSQVFPLHSDFLVFSLRTRLMITTQWHWWMVVNITKFRRSL